MLEGESLKFLLSSGIVIALLFSLYYAINRFNLSPRKFFYKGKELEVIDLISIGKDFSLVLIKVKNSLFLLAFTPSSVTLIQEFKEDGSSND